MLNYGTIVLCERSLVYCCFVTQFECVFLIWRGLQRVKTEKTRESISDWFRISRENFTVRGFSLVDLCCTVDSVGSSNT